MCRDVKNVSAGPDPPTRMSQKRHLGWPTQSGCLRLAECHGRSRLNVADVVAFVGLTHSGVDHPEEPGPLSWCKRSLSWTSIGIAWQESLTNVSISKPDSDGHVWWCMYGAVR